MLMVVLTTSAAADSFSVQCFGPQAGLPIRDYVGIATSIRCKQKRCFLQTLPTEPGKLKLEAEETVAIKIRLSEVNDGG